MASISMHSGFPSVSKPGRTKPVTGVQVRSYAAKAVERSQRCAVVARRVAAATR